MSLKLTSEPTSSSPLSFLGDGELSELIRTFPWENTSLGYPGGWPQNLRAILSTLFNSNNPHLLWWGPDLVQFYNNAYKLNLSEGKNHHIGQKAEECWPGIWPLLKPVIDQVLTTGKASWSEEQLIPFDRSGQASNVYWTYSYNPVVDETGHPDGVLLTCFETIDKVHNLKSLRESEEKLRFAVEAAELGTWDYRPGTATFFCNDRVKEWFGFGATDKVDFAIALSAVVPRDRENVVAAIEMALSPSSGGNYDVEFTIENLLNHKQRTVRAKGKAWFNEERMPYRFNGMVQDITEQVYARIRIQESEFLSKNIVKTSDAAQIIYLGEDMVVGMVNDRMLEVIGRDSSIVGKSLLQAIPELRETRILDNLRQVLHTGVPFHQSEEMVVLHRHGVPHHGYYNYKYKPMTNVSGEIYGINCTAFEVTEQVEARKRAEQTQQKAELAIASAELGTYELNLITGEPRADARTNEIWGLPADRPPHDYPTIIHPDDQAVRINAHAEAMRTGQLTYEARIIHQDNSIRWVKVNGKVLRAADGTATNLLGVIQDITATKNFTEELNTLVLQRTHELQTLNKELLAMNEELNRSNDLLVESRNSVEQFNFAASHDLQEPLRKIETFINLFRENSGSDITPQGDKYLAKAQKSVRLMRRIISDVMSYSHRTRSYQQFVKVDLNGELQIVRHDLEHLINKTNATIHSEVLPEMIGVQAQMHQVFLNLMDNALKFSKKDEPPIISITCSNLDPDQVKSHPGLNPSLSYFQLNFKDNGLGFEQRYSEHVFELFKRLHSKTDYEGTGIGLPLCKKIAESHKGDISVIANVNVGCTFQIILPYTQK